MLLYTESIFYSPKVKSYFPISININCSIIAPNKRKLVANKVPIEFENESIADVQ